ncbi:hypothetical protein GN244_ATG04790 [Phytophthora infestans]|uniref:Uncharacterized protein n=1 Tax=Phytophthora infestans TaxID=4787 RepID=A0A833SLX1_PHYIN|nr:hypothetical protein GN244_ATG04790 [Phytophthora infestans]
MGSHDAMTKSLAQALPPQPAPTYLDIERLVHDTLSELRLEKKLQGVMHTNGVETTKRLDTALQRHDEAIKVFGRKCELLDVNVKEWKLIKLSTDGENERDGSKQNGAESLKNRQVAEKSGFMQDQRIRGQPKCVETFWCRGIIDKLKRLLVLTALELINYVRGNECESHTEFAKLGAVYDIIATAHLG